MIIILQIFRIGTMLWDDKYGSQGLSLEVSPCSSACLCISFQNLQIHLKDTYDNPSSQDLKNTFRVNIKKKTLSLKAPIKSVKLYDIYQFITEPKKICYSFITNFNC